AARKDARVRALIDATAEYLNAGSFESIAVVVRDQQSRAALTTLLATEWGLRADELSDIGVTIESPRSVVGRGSDAVVGSGYYGAGTIDDLLRCGARAATLVLDPIESLGLYRGVETMTGALTAGQGLQNVLNDVGQAVLPYLPIRGAGEVIVGLSGGESLS